MSFELNPMRSKVATHLLDTARNFFIQAMSSFTAEEYLHFYLNAGTSIEHSLKARLADVHPTLIADPRHFDSMLILARLPLNELPPPIIRTVTITESIARCKNVVPTLTVPAQRINRIISYRNGVAHAGLIDRNNLPDDLSSFIQLIDLIIVDLNFPRDRFYSEYLEVVDARLDESKEREEIAVRAAIVAASRNYQRRYRGVSVGFNLEEALNSTDWDYPYEARPYECPACHFRAVLFGETYPEWETEFNDQGEIASTKLTAYFLVRSLECRICGLSLKSGLYFAGIPHEIILDDVDPDDFRELDENSGR